MSITIENLDNRLNLAVRKLLTTRKYSHRVYFTINIKNGILHFYSNRSYKLKKDKEELEAFFNDLKLIVALVKHELNSDVSIAIFNQKLYIETSEENYHLARVQFDPMSNCYLPWLFKDCKEDLEILSQPYIKFKVLKEKFNELANSNLPSDIQELFILGIRLSIPKGVEFLPFCLIPKDLRKKSKINKIIEKYDLSLVKLNWVEVLGNTKSTHSKSINCYLFRMNNEEEASELYNSHSSIYYSKYFIKGPDFIEKWANFLNIDISKELEDYNLAVSRARSI